VRFDILNIVGFQPEDYGPEVARLLERNGGGKRLMPLVHESGEAAVALPRVSAEQLFPGARSPQAALAGLYLYLAHWDEAHSTADAVEDPDGYFWHAIVHRQEPDPGNSAYWFRKTGAHPVFPRLAVAAAEAGYPAGDVWDPFAFIRFCESARERPASSEEQVAMQVQLAEWQILFDYCARGVSSRLTPRGKNG
jgi:hypothetical protein